MSRKNYTKTLVLSGILAALIFVFTYLTRIPINQNGAYMNIGDCVIYVSGMLVGAPWAAAAAGIGSMLADVMLGGGIYIPATLVIKALMGFVCALLLRKTRDNRQMYSEETQGEENRSWVQRFASYFKNNKAFVRFVLVCILGGAIMVVGYGVFEWVAFGWTYTIGALPFNLIQWTAGVVGAVVLYYPVRRIQESL